MPPEASATPRLARTPLPAAPATEKPPRSAARSGEPGLREGAGSGPASILSGRNLVVFANDWDTVPTSKHQVMKVLSRSNRVLWVNSIGLRRPGASVQDASRILRKLRQWLSKPRRINENMWAISPLVIPLHHLRWVRSINARLVSRYVRKQAKRLGMERFQVWVFLPSAASVLRHLDAEKIIYYCVDEWSEFSFLDAEAMREMEREVIAQSDLVFTSAQALYESRRTMHSRIHLIPHGVDGEHFAQVRSEALAVAPELEGLQRPVVGFWGALHDWIDLDLIRFVAERHPEWSVALVGQAEVDVADLARLPNVHLIGGRPYASLPAYAKGFDAAILPFKINRLTESVNPIKLREYLAAGLPVVSTPLPEVRVYGDLVRIGPTPEAFVRELESAVVDNSDAAVARRVEAVRGDTWVARVERMSMLVEEPVAPRSISST